jgi:TRAP-type C4-dicarboxylate transport system permease small subunit
VTNTVGAIGIISTMLILAFNVCSRKFGWPVPGAYSIATVLAVFLAVPAIIHAHFERAHIIIDSLKSKFSPRALVVLETIADAFTVGIWGLAAWVGLKYALKMWAVHEVLEPLKFQLAPFRFIWAIGLILVCIVIFVDRFFILKRKDRL